jgi:hypothetical protein
MKAVIGGFLMGAMILWALWALSAKEDCHQVERLANPVNLATSLARTLSWNWLDTADRIDLLIFSTQAREVSEKLIARTFYSKELTCTWSK